MVTTKKTLDGIEYEVGSGNVFADLGLADPEELMAKALLSIAIERAIEDKGLTHTAAAKRLHCTEVELCGLFGGDFSEFSMDRLFRFLTALGMDVRIEVGPKTAEASEAHVLVTLPEVVGADL
jgi:predicted XRE-type DNA-binding protein